MHTPRCSFPERGIALASTASSTGAICCEDSWTRSDQRFNGGGGDEP
ncbi:hypothetical protein PI125_g3823 [Phytophthora idaei]|nr:hypothetical protein PI125_g3823 [Phytophthora idaei]